MRWAERLGRLSETSTFRHATLSAFVFLLTALGTTFLSSRLIESLLMEHVRDMLLSEVQEHQRNARLSSGETLASILKLHASNEERIALVVAADGSLLFGDPHLLHRVGSTPHTGWHKLTASGADGQPMQIVGLQVQLDDASLFFSAFNILPMLERVRAIPVLAGAGLFAVLIASLGIGLYTSLRSLRRVDQIRSTLRDYVSGQRELRLATGADGDEYDLLSMDINHMLGRINTLMDEVRSVSSHLAHELRTPLTRLQHRLIEVADAADAGVREHILGSLQEAEHIQRLFKAVLRIGEIEAGRCPHALTWVDVEALFQDVVEYYLPLAEQAGIRLKCETTPGFTLWGDRALLFQALANLMENAFKYAPASECITLRAAHCDGLPCIGVVDHGPGIPTPLRALAIQRFRRLHSSQEGYGLGLSLVSAVARLHAGELKLSDNHPQGLAALLHFPPAQH